MTFSINATKSQYENTSIVRYISGPIMKMRIFSNYSPAWFIHSNHLSKHFFHSDWDISKTWFLNASTPSSGHENLWLHFVFLIFWNNKKSLGAKSELYGEWSISSTFWPMKKALLWADVRAILFQVISKYRYICRNVYSLQDKGKNYFLAKNKFFQGDLKISLFLPKYV